MGAINVASGSTPTKIVAVGTNPRFTLIQNDSDTEIRLFLDGTAPGSIILADGIAIAPRQSSTIPGGIFSSERMGNALFIYDVYALHGGSGNKTVIVQIA